ncbi:G-protein coupled receptor family C group 6 member A-like [Pagrus major]|uniref:G-protein coupled receptor family C group 6 member A-like n=1 Tax=Pagrus major TaxID=143350 RepID=UPI003CC8BFEF
MLPVEKMAVIQGSVTGNVVFFLPWFSVARLVQSLILVQTVEEVNKRQELGNLTLGYHILDSCSDVTTALINSQSFMRRNSTYSDGAEQPSPPALVVIGGYYSEISIAVARQLNLENIPQISYGSTSGLLSDKNRFPSFMRTVPEDDHQARAIIDILKNHQWTWVGVVTTDGDYGRYAVERLKHHAKGSNICFSFIHIFSDVLGSDSLMEDIGAAAKSIAENENVQVIVSFAKPYHMKYLFKYLRKHPQGRGKVWVASDNWSESTFVLNKQKLSDIGTVLGTTLKSGNPTRLKQYLRNLDANPDSHKDNSFLCDFLKKKQQQLVNPGYTANEQLENMIYPYAVFSVELAVRAIAQAVADLCVNRDCKTGQRLQPLELREALRRATFHMDGENYSFDDKGDLNSGYEVILWNQSSPTDVDVHYVVAHYNSTVCRWCNTTTHYSLIGSYECLPKKTVFLKWNDEYEITLLAFTALGALLTIVVGIIFLACWNTPVVRASVGPICIILLFALLSTFVSVILFGGKPLQWQCKTRQVLFGLSFTLCVSCILVKSIKIILAFEFDPNVQRVLKKLYQPYVIIAACMSGQVIICALWLALRSPTTELKDVEKKHERLLRCAEKSFPAFGAMLSYIGVLAIICFGVAFKGRNLPHCYNDAKFITFAMLIYFISWIIFGPVYANVTGEYLPAVEMVVILISAYGILFCQFVTKCYIILFKQEANTVSAFRQDVRNYSLGSIPEVENKTQVLSSPRSEGIQNPAFDVETPVSNSPSILCQLSFQASVQPSSSPSSSSSSSSGQVLLTRINSPPLSDLQDPSSSISTNSV